MSGFAPSPELYPFASRWFESSAGRVHYLDEGEGRPVLLVHGNPTWSFLWRGIVTRLRDRFRCVAPDLPGFSLSERPSGYGYTPAEHARVVGELVETLDLRDAVLVGHDWGGPIGAAAGVAAPARFTGLAFANTALWPADGLRAAAFSRLMSSRPLQWAILEKNLFVRLIQVGTARRLTREELGHYRAVLPTREARLGVAELPRQIRAAGSWLAELERALPSLADRPALLVWGMRDPVFRPRATIPRLRALFPDSLVVELPRAKHFVQEDAPAETARAIAERFG